MHEREQDSGAGSLATSATGSTIVNSLPLPGPSVVLARRGTQGYGLYGVSYPTALYSRAS